MKKILISTLCAALSSGLLPLRAQQQDCTVPMVVLVGGQSDGIPEASRQALTQKLRQAVTQNGMEGGAKFATFSLVGHATEGNKEALSGSRPLITLTLNLELFVGNNYTGEKFAATSLTLNGAGQSEAQAFSAAFAQINTGNARLQQFLKEAKEKVNTYYATQTPAILSRARAFATRHEYEEALALLSSVPTCSSQYADVEDALVEVFQSYVDYDGAQKVAAARAVWAAAQDKEAAAKAGALLASIDPSSSAIPDAQQLAEQIRQRIGDDWEFYKEIARETVAIEKSRLAAIRDIGVAYGENQKSTTLNEHWMVR